MPRKKGDLPGRFVNAHIRKWPNRPGEYVDVAAYQERVEPPPSELLIIPPQMEFDLQMDSLPKEAPSQIAASSRAKFGRSRMRRRRKPKAR